MAIFVTSDWHFNHERSFIYGPRGFSSIDEMNEAIIERHNSVVGPDDTVFVLGDLMLGDNAKGFNCIKRLNGNLVVIAGNHDTPVRRELYKGMGLEVYDALTFKYQGYHFYLSHYPTITINYDENKPLKTRVINLCGHYHTTNPFQDMEEKGILSYHVEVDAHNCYPILLDKIILNLELFGQK